MSISSSLRKLLKNAESVCALTGAGVSAESGVPTFRGADGLWTKFKPEELASFDAFIKNPELVWEWYAYRKKVMMSVLPNPGHRAFVEFEQLLPDFTLVTQNVDNLHRRAGSQRVLELHGNIERSYCIACGHPAKEIALGPEKKAPRCTACAGLVRPDVVWFGELLPQETFEDAMSAARRAQLFLIVGTSGVVYPAASLPLLAKEHGAFVVEVNDEYTDLSSHWDETILGKAGTILPEMVTVCKHVRGETAL